MFKAGISWKPTDRMTVSSSLRYSGSWSTVYQQGTIKKTIDSRWTLDAAFIRADIYKGIDLEFSLKNILDSADPVPGTYSTIESDRFRLYLGLRKRF